MQPRKDIVRNIIYSLLTFVTQKQLADYVNVKTTDIAKWADGRGELNLYDYNCLTYLLKEKDADLLDRILDPKIPFLIAEPQSKPQPKLQPFVETLKEKKKNIQTLNEQIADGKLKLKKLRDGKDQLKDIRLKKLRKLRKRKEELDYK